MNPVQVKARSWVSLLLLGALVFSAGCSSTRHKSGTPVAWNIKLVKTTTSSVEVDLIGISISEDSYWSKSVKPDDYWNPSKPIRSQAESRAWSTRFETAPVSILKIDDKIWNQWLGYGASELLILASLRGRYSNDENDPRRLILDIGKNHWQAKDKTLELEVLDGQIRVLTRPKSG
jgi:hypothetical protein